MQFLLTILFLFLFLPFAAFSDVAGTWALSGVGCRGASLSANSHSSRSKSDSRYAMRASVLKLNSDGSASMMIEGVTGDDEEKTKVRNETGEYKEVGDTVEIVDRKVHKSEPVLIFDIVGNELVMVENNEYFDGESNPSCEDGDIFVYVFRQV